jgi:hypothetical protein
MKQNKRDLIIEGGEHEVFVDKNFWIKFRHYTKCMKKVNACAVTSLHI